MNGEMVSTVQGANAVPAKPIGLADAGLKEREHLQEWVIEHPQVLGLGVKIVAFEFGVATVLCPVSSLRQHAGSVCPDCEIVHA